jgi:hypothetical protein
MYGRGPQLKGDVHMVLGESTDAPSPADNFYVALGKRLQRAYAFVRVQQERMAANNRERREHAAKHLEFKDNDMVLYWEPQQRRLLHTDPADDDVAIAMRAPSKWTPKLTKPHKVLRRIAPTRYIIAHVERGIEVETHVNKLCLFNAWSARTPSTSNELDEPRPFTTGTWADKDALFIIPLQAPWPFGVGKVLQAHADGRLNIQWLGSGTNSVRATLALGWKTPKGTATYYANTLRREEHLPYCVDDDANGVAFHQHDVILHGFELTKEGRKIPAVILRALAAHPDIWWDGGNEELLRE